jgi:hypothetical protein
MSGLDYLVVGVGAPAREWPARVASTARRHRASG